MAKGDKELLYHSNDTWKALAVTFFSEKPTANSLV